MKKIITLGLALLLLTGCSDAYANVKNVKNLITVGKTTITNKTIYPVLVDNNGIDHVIQFINANIFKNVCSKDINIEAEVDKEIAELVAKEGEKFYLNFYQPSLESYRKIAISNKQTSEIIKAYLEVDYANVVETYKPTKVQIADFKDVESAKKALADIKAGADFKATAAKYAAVNNKGAIAVMSTLSNLPPEVASYAFYATEPNTVDSPITANDGKFYVVRVIDVNREGYKQEILDSLKGNVTINKKAISYFCKQLKISYHDKTVIDMIAQSYPEYLGK